MRRRSALWIGDRYTEYRFGHICGLELCPAVVGNIIVWRDSHDLTANCSLALASNWRSRLALIGLGKGLLERAGVWGLSGRHIT